MRGFLLVVLTLGVGLAPLHGAGLLIPQDKTLPPLAMVNHQVTIAIEDQVAITRVEQTFRNHTNRQLEATYVFPVPRGASVDRFTMWVDGKETKGELLESGKAREIYTSIVRRTQDPGLLEYIGTNLLQMRVFPVPPNGEQKVVLRYNSIAPREGKLVEFVYPLKHDSKAIPLLDKFTITATVKSQHGVMNVYSPSHPLVLKRISDKEVQVSFEKDKASLDRDFQLFYSTGNEDVGLTALAHRPSASDKGFVSLLISPRFGSSETKKIPQDVVLVMDTSGSMRGEKIDQARKALDYCLRQLTPSDRFGLLAFATGVNPFEDKLLEASPEQIKKAQKWVADLEATGGTAINAALEAALKMRPSGDDRPFTILFFTDGMPTIGETNSDTIFKNITARNTANTRIFTFGVGNDVNAALLDQLAESTRAASVYVRPEENIAAKAEGLYAKISSPVLTSLKLTTTGDIKLDEVYPPELPDLFQGGQLVVFARYSGQGSGAIRLTGKEGKESREFVYEYTFPDKTDDRKDFVEQLWARRKVGYLLDQIRTHGEKTELKDEVIALAKKYGITTPYTSYLIVPDGPLPTPAPPPGPRPIPLPRPVPLVAVPPGLEGVGGAAPGRVLDLARKPADERQAKRSELADRELRENASRERGAGGSVVTRSTEALEKKAVLEQARQALARRGRDGISSGKLGVDLALQMNQLRGAAQVQRSAVRTVAGRRCLEVGGVWIDEEFTPKTEAVVVKALSDAYFRLLEKQPQLQKVFGLGNYLVWITPSGKALVIDANDGKDKLTDAEIAALFVAGK